MDRPPDRSCDTGGPGGYDVWTWNCINGQRVVVYRLRGEWGCNKPRKETVPCGRKTPFELKTAGRLAGCRPMPRRFRWPRK